MDDHQKFRFSITCETQDVAVLHCLRALCQWAEEHPKPQIGWGGTTKEAWELSKGKFTLRFTSAEYRERFVEKAKLLLSEHWTAVETSEHNPAVRQRTPR
jgi:hypothetical protein